MPAQQDSNLTLIGLWPWGPCVAVAAKNNYAFIGNGGLFQVLDISDPLSPQIVGELFFGGLLVYDMAISGDFVYIPDGDLKVVDISEPTKPQLVAKLLMPGDFAHRIAVSGNYAYLGTVRGQLIVVDISSPITPTIKSTTRLYDEFVSLIVPHNNHLFVKTESPLAPIYIYDVTDPSNPTLAGSHGVRSYAFALDEQFLYLCTDDSSFQVWNVTSPATPNLISRIKTPFAGSAVKIKDNVAYITAGKTLLATLDVSDSSQPILLGTVTGFPETIRSLAIAYPLILAPSGVGFWILDVTESNRIETLHHFTTGEASSNLEIVDNFLFLCNLKAGLFVLNISNPPNPQFVTNLSVGGWVDDLAIAEGVAFISGYPFGENTPPELRIVDVSQPSLPQMLAQIAVLPERPLGGIHPTALAVSEKYSFVTHNLGMSIMDISDKRDPRFIKWIQSERVAFDVAISGNFVCLANGEAGLRIIDISDPQNPREKTTYPGIAIGAITRNDTAFVALGGELVIFKISPFGDLSKLGEIATPGSRSTVDLSLQGHFVFMAYGENLIVIDISSSAQPRIVGYALTPAYAGGVAVKSNHIFVAGGAWALQVYRNDLITRVDEEPIHHIPIAPLLHRSYPNPFNASSIIEYEIPQAGKVDLRVFNVLGKEVARLVSSWQDAGRHRIFFDGTKLPTGVYFYRLRVDGWQRTQKVLVVR